MNIRNLLQSLVDHKVKFVIIGAVAFPAYGYMRNTMDIEIFFNPTKNNAERLIKAMSEFGYLGLDDLSLEELIKKKTLFRQYPLNTDTHPFVKGVKFAEVWKAKKEVEIEKIKVFVPSLEHLIKMKKAAGRKKDIADLEFLEEIRKQITKKKK
ncbi:MAG TPA: nucleotidyltransferase [Ignavibacteriaceae bacterium]|nr:nucleotidyltransferase [Ignavibacteriaceae bacterium]